MTSKHFLIIVFFLITSHFGKAQELYSKAFGDPKNHPILFLHGGPGYNAAGFEITTASALAEQGFYVIIYDRRGEGRSNAVKAQFNFSETFSDMHTVLRKYGITKATLIGHSFGGMVGTLFAKQYPENVSAIVLVGAPVSLQETFKTIISSSKKIYEANNDTTNLAYIGMLEQMDTTSAEYYAYSFAHAMQNGFYSPKKMSNEAKALYAAAAANPTFGYVSKMTAEAPQGFLKNEKYTSIDLTNDLHAMQKSPFKIYGMYGKEDGLYSVEQINQLRQILGDDHLMYLDNCSHNVFIDQQSLFFEFLKKKLK